MFIVKLDTGKADLGTKKGDLNRSFEKKESNMLSILNTIQKLLLMSDHRVRKRESGKL